MQKDSNGNQDVKDDDRLIEWYYEKMQSIGRSQGRLLWTSFVLFLFSMILFFDPEGAKEISLLGIPIQNLERIWPAAIFLVLAVLQGSIMAVADPIDRIEEIIGKRKKRPDGDNPPYIRGMYSIDSYLNFLDFITFTLNSIGLRALSNLLYPLFIIMVGAGGILLFYKEIGLLHNPCNSTPTFFFAAIDLIFAVFCAIVSFGFIMNRWGKFKGKIKAAYQRRKRIKKRPAGR